MGSNSPRAATTRKINHMVAGRVRTRKVRVVTTRAMGTRVMEARDAATRMRAARVMAISNTAISTSHKINMAGKIPVRDFKIQDLRVPDSSTTIRDGVRIQVVSNREVIATRVVTRVVGRARVIGHRVNHHQTNGRRDRRTRVGNRADMVRTGIRVLIAAVHNMRADRDHKTGNRVRIGRPAAVLLVRSKIITVLSSTATSAVVTRVATGIVTSQDNTLTMKTRNLVSQNLAGVRKTGISVKAGMVATREVEIQDRATVLTTATSRVGAGTHTVDLNRAGSQATAMISTIRLPEATAMVTTMISATVVHGDRRMTMEVTTADPEAVMMTTVMMADTMTMILTEAGAAVAEDKMTNGKTRLLAGFFIAGRS